MRIQPREALPQQYYVVVGSSSKSADEPEQQLVEAGRRGDRRALEAIFRTQMPALERLLFRLLGPSSDVPDLVQVVLVEALRAFPRFRGEASVRTWLSRIAVNVVKEHLRRPEHWRRVTLAVLPGGDEPDPTQRIDEVVDTRRGIERLYGHLQTLSPKNRVAFILFVVDGRPMDEVAAIVGASRVATKSRVFLARRALLALVREDPMLATMLTRREGSA